MTVILKGFIEVPEKDVLEVSGELLRHIQLTRDEPGCIIFSVEQDQIYPNRFNVYEEFINQDAFDAHQKRVKNSRWGEVSKNALRNHEITEE